MHKPNPKYGWHGEDREVDTVALGISNELLDLRKENRRLVEQVAGLNAIIDELAKAVPTHDLRLVVAPLNREKDYTQYNGNFSRTSLVEDLRIALEITPVVETPHEALAYRVPTQLKGSADRVPEAHFALGF